MLEPGKRNYQMLKEKDKNLPAVGLFVIPLIPPELPAAVGADYFQENIVPKLKNWLSHKIPVEILPGIMVFPAEFR